MELSAIREFWRELKTTVHPADAAVMNNYPGVFNLDYPSPAFTGDVLNARIIIVMGNGGYKPGITDSEYVDPETADWQLQRLREPDRQLPPAHRPIICPVNAGSASCPARLGLSMPLLIGARKSRGPCVAPRAICPPPVFIVSGSCAPSCR